MATVTAYLCNPRTGAHGEYTHFAFNSLAQIGAFALGAQAGCVYALSGTTDAGTAIDAAVLTGITDFSDERSGEPASQFKRVEEVFANARLGGEELAVRVITDETTDRLYPKRPHPKEGLASFVVPTAKGIEGRNWQFGVETVDGGAVEIERMDVAQIVLKTRQK